MSEGLTLEWIAKSNNGTGTLKARIGDDVIHVDDGHLTKSAFRDKFIDRVCRNGLGSTDHEGVCQPRVIAPCELSVPG